MVCVDDEDADWESLLFFSNLDRLSIGPGLQVLFLCSMVRDYKDQEEVSTAQFIAACVISLKALQYSTNSFGRNVMTLGSDRVEQDCTS